jgi:hypothetical protein
LKEDENVPSPSFLKRADRERDKKPPPLLVKDHLSPFLKSIERESCASALRKKWPCNGSKFTFVALTVNTPQIVGFARLFNPKVE